MWNQRLGIESTCSAGTPLERELADVLDAYLAQLERGETVDTAALLAAHPQIADELRVHLEDVKLLQGATARMRKIEAAAETSLDPRQIGEYRILREIGRGGMGIVYLARDVRLDRDVAIKVLPSHLADMPDARDRFLREARTAASLSHPHIVPIHRVGEAGGRAHRPHRMRGRRTDADLEQVEHADSHGEQPLGEGDGRPFYGQPRRRVSMRARMSAARRRMAGPSVPAYRPPP